MLTFAPLLPSGPDRELPASHVSRLLRTTFSRCGNGGGSRAAMARLSQDRREYWIIASPFWSGKNLNFGFLQPDEFFVKSKTYLYAEGNVMAVISKVNYLWLAAKEAARHPPYLDAQWE